MAVSLEISRQILEKYTSTKFYENQSSGSQAVPCDKNSHDEVNG
jgi:hypothetical protein